MKLVVGLAISAIKHVNTRHNIGSEVADALARNRTRAFAPGNSKGDEVTLNIGGQRVLLLKPSTLMDLSGDAISAAARFYKIPSKNVLIICDYTDLPPGKLRLRANGSDGGHNGLWSVINRLDEDFPRLRIGIGEHPPEMARWITRAAASWPPNGPLWKRHGRTRRAPWRPG